MVHSRQINEQLNQISPYFIGEKEFPKAKLPEKTKVARKKASTEQAVPEERKTR